MHVDFSLKSLNITCIKPCIRWLLRLSFFICDSYPISNIYLLTIILNAYFTSIFQVAPIIKERMMKKGSMMLSYQPHRGKVNFFRQVIISPQVIHEDMDFLLDEIDSLGKDL
uniref:Uncharacterized protein n=1 Tax=Laticauda laticaudata TaxID=8630 RepID=A0A8C5SQM8_LATLA